MKIKILGSGSAFTLAARTYKKEIKWDYIQMVLKK
jgi:hypothetical protein